MDTTTRRFPVPPEHHGVAAPPGGDITPSALLYILRGVFTATETPEDDLKTFERWLSSRASSGWRYSVLVPEEEIQINSSAESWFSAWHSVIGPAFSENDGQLRQLVNLALMVFFLRESRRRCRTISGADITFLWDLVHNALTSPQLTRSLSIAFRGAQGFFVIPLCSLTGKNGDGDELYRLHIWLPDDQRGDPDFCIHSYQTLIQSWILAGEGHYSTFKVETVADPVHATHVEYESTWQASKNLSMQYSADQIFRNTGRLVRAIKIHSSVHTFNMSYFIEPATFHALEVSPDALHAGLFLFDSRRASAADARILCPKHIDTMVRRSNPASSTLVQLASALHTVRSWQILLNDGKWHARRSEMEDALRVFNCALSLSETVDCFPNASYYARLVHAQLGFTNRCLGRYDKAKENLEEALKEPRLTQHRLKSSGELGTVYRAMNQMPEARIAFETQYDIAKQLRDDRGMCRAVGNLGMTNYQISQQNHDDALLELAIKQLKERISRARHITEILKAEKMDPRKKAGRLKQAAVWESIGLNRLSLCYTAQGNTREAVIVARKSQSIKIEPEDLTVIAMSHFFCGRALLRDGQREAALEHFNPSIACTPAIALCKEPSEEHRQYLQELVDVGVDMDLIDEYGYTALDYAVFGSDTEMGEIVIEGLRDTLKGDVDAKIAQCRTEARLRKGYRELFQDKMRPVLLSGGADALQNLRIVYADALAAEEEKTQTKRFDTLKYVRYSDFLRSGRLPRYSDGFTKDLLPEFHRPQEGLAAEFMIFFSYRWNNQAGNVSSPDDTNNSQYHRMLMAAKDFLTLNPSVNPDRLGIWVDYACINQDNPTPGIAALPLILAQCNAVISIVDNSYYRRAWCMVETAMVQTLQKSYKKHFWYEYAPLSERGNKSEEWALRAGPLDLDITAADKELTFEEDRPKVLFLERQTKLIR